MQRVRDQPGRRRPINATTIGTPSDLAPSGISRIRDGSGHCHNACDHRRLDDRLVNDPEQQDEEGGRNSNGVTGDHLRTPERVGRLLDRDLQTTPECGKRREQAVTLGDVMWMPRSLPSTLGPQRHSEFERHQPCEHAKVDVRRNDERPEQPEAEKPRELQGTDAARSGRT